MAIIANLAVAISAQTTQFNRGMRNAQGSMRRFGVTVKETKRGIGLFAASVAALGALLGYKMIRFMSGSVQSYIEAEKAQAKLAAVIKATGGAAGFTAKEMQEYASDLQSTTTFSDDAIVNAEALLATFKEIKGDVFKDATAAMLDMSEVMGQDVSQVAIQLGKALNDPIKGLTALSRVGVSFTEDQKKQIRTFVESGRVMEAQRVILDELKSEFGGAAAAAANTFGGRMAQLGNIVDDVKEKFGAALAPAIQLVAEGIIKAMPAIENIADWLGRNVPKAILTLKYVWIKLGDMITQGVLESQYAVVKFASQVKHFFVEVIPSVLTWFGENWEAILTDIANLAMTVFENIGKNIVKIIKNIPALIKGDVTFAELWTPLTEGFVATLTELPDIAEREIGDLERTLGQAVADFQPRITESFAEYMAKGLENLVKGVEGKAGGGKGKDTQLPQGIAATLPAALEKGTTGAYSAIVQAKYGAQERAAERTADNTDDMNMKLGETNVLLNRLVGAEPEMVGL